MRGSKIIRPFRFFVDAKLVGRDSGDAPVEPTPPERLHLLAEATHARAVLDAEACGPDAVERFEILRLGEVNRDVMRAGAAALDRLAQTCGTCQHADTENAMGGWVFCAACSSDRGDDRYKFPFAYRPVSLDERCKGWTKREDA